MHCDSSGDGSGEVHATTETEAAPQATAPTSRRLEEQCSAQTGRKTSVSLSLSRVKLDYGPPTELTRCRDIRVPYV
jgi:hypothetical protein